MNYKLTIDLSLANQGSSESMEKLRKWMGEGKIQLIEAQPTESRNASYNWPGLPPKAPPAPRGKYKPVAKANSKFREVAAVLFPSKDSHKLAMGEINLVAHLVKHLDSRNEFFITLNVKDLIAEGKRDRLKRSFGIIAATPEEVVQMLGQVEGWE